MNTPTTQRLEKNNAFGIASFVFGLISIFIFSPIFVPLGVIFGALALLRSQVAWAVVGLTCSAVGFATSPILIGLTVGFIEAAARDRKQEPKARESQIIDADGRSIASHHESSGPVVSDATVRSRQGTANLDSVFDPNMLNVDLAYFEKLVGPAKFTRAQEKIYIIDGCEVVASLRDGSVRSFGLHVTTECTFDINRYLHNYHGAFPDANKLTFGEFDRIVSGGVAYTDVTYTADCLRDCGNIADPILYAQWFSSSADNNIEIRLEAKQSSDDVIEAANKWESVMIRAEGEDWVIFQKYKCYPMKYNEVARDALKGVPISGITIGRDIKQQECSKD